MCDSHSVCVDTSTSQGVCVNATDYEYPLEAKGASPPPGGANGITYRPRPRGKW